MHQSILTSVVLVLLVAAYDAQAAVISITQANLTSPTQIDNSGTYISGTNLVNDITSSPVVNGVLFKAAANQFEGPSGTPGTFKYLGGSGQASGIFPGGTLGADLNELLDSTLFANAAANMAVVGLDPSQTYRLQLVAGDNRAFSSSQNWEIHSGTFTPNGGVGTYVQGTLLDTFSIQNLGASISATHNAELITILFSGESAINIRAVGGGQAFLNGMALHAIPEPSSITVFLIVGVGMLWFAKRRTPTRAARM